MPSSTDQVFARMDFPQVRQPDHAATNEAFVRGHAAGYAAGLQVAAAELAAKRAALEEAYAALRDELRAQTEAVIGTLNQAAQALHHRNAPVISSIENVLAAAAVELAEAVLGHELGCEDRRQVTRSAIERALAHTQPEEIISVHLHPGDLAVLSEADVNAVGVRLVSDPSLDRGDALAMLPAGFLDARISSALKRAKAALLGGNE